MLRCRVASLLCCSGASDQSTCQRAAGAWQAERDHVLWGMSPGVRESTRLFLDFLDVEQGFLRRAKAPRQASPDRTCSQGRGPAAHSKTGQLTLRYIGSPDTGSGEGARRFGAGGWGRVTVRRSMADSSVPSRRGDGRGRWAGKEQPVGWLSWVGDGWPSEQADPRACSGDRACCQRGPLPSARSGSRGCCPLDRAQLAGPGPLTQTRPRGPNRGQASPLAQRSDTQAAQSGRTGPGPPVSVTAARRMDRRLLGRGRHEWS